MKRMAQIKIENNTEFVLAEIFRGLFRTMIWLKKKKKLESTAISTTEYLNLMKRLADLEEKVIALNGKPAELPPEKEEMLNSTLRRLAALEYGTKP
ncbi:hypothetical protein L2E82_10851 [Cichorium intybus]|uniref:Uncharacterized protein n=1 Tax=Cichorium intybus TaxID=13427 RepID=A0ACB9GCR9_CICIN|nr:hypothetical protein L2E82_10851 [Cichorium intybus]